MKKVRLKSSFDFNYYYVLYLYELQVACLVSGAVLGTVWCSVEDDVGLGSGGKRGEGSEKEGKRRKNEMKQRVEGGDQRRKVKERVEMKRGQLYTKLLLT